MKDSSAKNSPPPALKSLLVLAGWLADAAMLLNVPFENQPKSRDQSQGSIGARAILLDSRYVNMGLKGYCILNSNAMS